MTAYDMQTAAGLIAQPQTPAQTLADIAAQHPYLRAAVRQHPNAYPELIAWIDQVEGTGGAPSGQARHRKPGRGLVWGIGVAALAVVALALVLVFAPFGRGGGSAERLLAAVPMPVDPDYFNLLVLDHERLQEAMGEPYPFGGSEDEIERWIALAGTGDEQRVSLGTFQARSWSADDVTNRASHSLILLDYEAYVTYDYLSVYWGFTEEQLTDAYGPSDSGVWGTEGLAVLTRHDDVTFSRTRPDLLPDRLPERSGSLASDTAVLAALQALEASGGYSYTVMRDPRNQTRKWLAFSTDEEAAPIEATGFGLGTSGDAPHLTLVYAHGDDEAAEQNLPLIAQMIEQTAESYDQGQPQTRRSGSVVVVELDLAPQGQSLELLAGLLSILTPGSR